MQDLKVIGVENGALLVATDAGGEYRLPVTTSLHSQLRAASPDRTPREQKISPREVQASIRAGKSAEEVASSTGVELDYVRRFEGPVMAERSYVLDSARAVGVSVGADASAPSDESKFGDVIDSRLEASEAADITWSAYKDVESGWVVHVTYTAQEIERSATWRFDPKKSTLAPLDGDAHTLSRQGNDPAPLVPRLRAVGGDASESGRFDSGAFEVEVEVTVDEVVFDGGDLDRHRFDSRSPASMAATNRAPEAAPDHNQTADLLEALRRRRGEREAARFEEKDDARNAHPSTGSLRVIDVPLDDFDEPEGDTKPVETQGRVTDHPAANQSAPATPTQSSSRSRKGRASMPSWDEIVFGARPDDDLA